MQELASLGLDRLKSALIALGLKCGGYVTRQFSSTTFNCLNVALRGASSSAAICSSVHPFVCPMPIAHKGEFYFYSCYGILIGNLHTRS